MASSMKIMSDNRNVTGWSLENGYDDNFHGNEYPRRVFNANQDFALIVFLRLFEQDLEHFCRGPFQGYKIILKTPGDALTATRHFVRVPLSQSVQISVKPTYITTSKELQTVEPNRRQCFFSLERKLRFFKIYTQAHCEAECLANFTANECGCVKFSMPRVNSTRICGAASVKCYKKAEITIFGQDVIDGLSDGNARSFREKCNCLPSCTAIMYDAEIDRTQFDWDAIVTSLKIPSNKTEK